MPDSGENTVTEYCSACKRKIREIVRPADYRTPDGHDYLNHSANPLCRRYGREPDSTLGEVLRDA